MHPNRTMARTVALSMSLALLAAPVLGTAPAQAAPTGTTITMALPETALPPTPPPSAPNKTTPQPKPPKPPASSGNPLPRDPRKPDVMVGKKHPLQPLKFAPKLSKVPGSGFSLQPEATRAYKKMTAAAKKDGVDIRLVSGYRSYATQKGLFDRYAKRDGIKAAERYSARAGTSEHQTGWGLDVGTANGSCRLKSCFATTPAGRWMKKNAPTHGFILRYPAGMEAVTGYIHEPWHFRYLGIKPAAAYAKSGAKTLEEYHGLLPKPPAQWGVRRSTAKITLHATAKTGSKALARIPAGTELYYTANKSGWLKVEYRAKKGWIRTTGTKKAKAAPRTTTLNLNLYAAPTTSGTRLAKVPLGSIVQPTGQRSGVWYRVTVNKQTGWLSGRYLR